MNQKRIGKFIKEKRIEKDLTQVVLAEKLGVSNRSISKWENGVCLPDYSVLNDLCKILDISVDELLNGEEIEEIKKDKKKSKKKVLITLIIFLIVFYILYKLFILVYFDNQFIYREEDKVLQLTNMPEENIFNGDIGIIDSVDKKEIVVNFDDNYVRFTPSNFNNFKHGYAISIHKAQGSEFKTVVIPVVREYNKMLYRKLYYTGVTRAKKELYIVGDLDSLKYASRNNNSDIRRTSIKDRLINVMEKKD